MFLSSSKVQCYWGMNCITCSLISVCSAEADYSRSSLEAQLWQRSTMMNVKKLMQQVLYPMIFQGMAGQVMKVNACLENEACELVLIWHSFVAGSVVLLWSHSSGCYYGSCAINCSYSNCTYSSISPCGNCCWGISMPEVWDSNSSSKCHWLSVQCP